MDVIADRLRYWIKEVPERLDGFTDDEISERPSPCKWSKKEIMGHLCDSALNNLPRFVKTQFEEQPSAAAKYDQDKWVESHGYQNIPTEEIVQLWVSLNQQIARVIKKTPEEKYPHLCVVGDNPPVTLEWLIQDYLEHMEHHLQQILEFSRQ